MANESLFILTTTLCAFIAIILADPSSSLVSHTAGSVSERSSSPPPTNNSCPAACLCGMGTSQQTRGYFPTVDCRNRKLVRLPADFPRETVVLLLRGNALSAFKPRAEFDEANVLSDLDLSYNRIASLDLSEINGTSLKFLNLNSNNLDKIAASCSLGSARNLEQLLLAENKIESLEAGCFDGLGNLQRLTLTGNRISTLKTDSFLGLVSLRFLAIDRSQVVAIEDRAFRSLSSLDTLALSYNEISRVSFNAFDGLEKLQHLSLAGNRLVGVPSEALLVFQSLKSLNFDFNPIRKLTRQGMRSFSVQEISLRYMNELELIDKEAFHDLRTLSVIGMSNNRRLAYIDPNAISSCSKITVLYLNNNSLLTFSNSSLTQLGELQKVDLRDNPLRCDCNTHWLVDHVSGSNSRPRIDVTGGSDFCKYTTKAPSNSTGSKQTTKSDLAVLVFDVRNASLDQTLSEPKGTYLDEHRNNTNSEANNSSEALFSYNEHCSPVVIQFFNDTIYQQLGSTLVLDCRATGVPAPAIYWIFANRKVINSTSNYSRLRLDSRGTLTVEHVKQQDAGRYTCVASNVHGSDEAPAILRLYSPSARLLCQTVGSSFITVSWTGTDSSVASVQYAVLYQPLGNASTSTTSSAKLIELGRYMRSYWIGNLAPLTVYEVCIAYARGQPREYVKIDCSHVQTKSAEAAAAAESDGIYRVASRTVLAAILVACATPVVACSVVVLIRRHYRRKAYADPLEGYRLGLGDCYSDSLEGVCRGAGTGLRGCGGGAGQRRESDMLGRFADIKALSHIPLDNLYHLPSTPLSTSRTSLIS